MHNSEKANRPHIGYDIVGAAPGGLHRWVSSLGQVGLHGSIRWQLPKLGIGRGQERHTACPGPLLDTIAGSLGEA